MNAQNAEIFVATSYPILADAFRSYLRGHYEVRTIHHSAWCDGLFALERALSDLRPTAIVVDDTFPFGAEDIAGCVANQHADIGLIFLDANPNIFRVLHYQKTGFQAYLYLGDELSSRLRGVVDAVRRGERFLSPSIHGLYERYMLFQGVFGRLSPKLEETFKLMGEGLSAGEIQQRLDIDISVVYRRQYRLRKYFGVEGNRELLEIIRLMYEDDPQTLLESGQSRMIQKLTPTETPATSQPSTI
jgi:DNA-binding NarL/FixJ family response regulator